MSEIEERRSRPTDAFLIQLQPEQARHMEKACPEWRSILGEQKGTWTLARGDDVLAIGGIAEIWTGRALAFAYIGAGLRMRDWVYVTRLAARLLAEARYRRIEADVRCGFEAGMRWAYRLGFEFEGVSQGYFPDGQDGLRFAKVRRA